MENKVDVLFEVSFEVCNKVGGIYAVLESKAARMVEKYGNNYFAIGPYYAERAITEAIKQRPPEFFEKAFSTLEKEGMRCYFGNWMIQGRPNVILVEFSELLKKIDDIKKVLWEKYKIDSWESGFDFNEPVAWSTAVGMLIEKLVANLDNKKAEKQARTPPTPPNSGIKDKLKPAITKLVQEVLDEMGPQ